MMFEVNQESIDIISSTAMAELQSLAGISGFTFNERVFTNFGELVSKSFYKDLAVGNHFIGDFESETALNEFLSKLTKAYTFEIYDKILRIVKKSSNAAILPYFDIDSSYKIVHDGSSTNNAMAEDSPIDTSASFKVSTPKIKTNAINAENSTDTHSKPDYTLLIYDWIEKNTAKTYNIIRDKFVTMIYEYNTLF